MGIFTRELAGKAARTHGNGCYGAQSVPEMTVVQGSTSVASVQGFTPVSLV